MVFWYVYLRSEDVESSTGVIHIHVIYDVVNDSGVPKPIMEGLFEQPVTLLFAGVSSVNKPLFCLIGADYLTKTSLKEAALWNR